MMQVLRAEQVAIAGERAARRKFYVGSRRRGGSLCPVILIARWQLSSRSLSETR